jgi:RNA polymerase sigma factor (TIGR02999 family)
MHAIGFIGRAMMQVTQILNAMERGDPKASDELLPVVYDELRRLAAQKLSHEPSGQTLQATALVHEAYLRLVGTESQPWNSRGHFFAAAAEAMRRILVENARRKRSIKNGGRRQRLSLDEITLAPADDRLADDLILLDEALAKLAQRDPLKADLVKLRYFAGLTIAQTAEALDISHATAERHWDYARSWLHVEIKERRRSGRPE